MLHAGIHVRGCVVTLAQRDAELRALATRGRRRSLLIMILAYVPIPFVLVKLNNAPFLAGLIPLGPSFVAGIFYSWTKWHRRPEDSQSVAFVGLDRKRRSATYRSMWRGSRIDDPVVLTIVESIHHHLQRSVAVFVATMVAIAVMTVVLVQTGGDSVSPLICMAIIVLAGGVIAEHRWIINRSAQVIVRSRP